MTRVTIAPGTHSLGLTGTLSDGSVRAYRKLSLKQLKAIESNIRRNYDTCSCYKSGQARLEQIEYFYRGHRLIAVYIPDDPDIPVYIRMARQYNPGAWGGINNRARFGDGLTDTASEILLQYAGLQPLEVEFED